MHFTEAASILSIHIPFYHDFPVRINYNFVNKLHNLTEKEFIAAHTQRLAEYLILRLKGHLCMAATSKSAFAETLESNTPRKYTAFSSGIA